MTINFQYQWLRDMVPITGATTEHYTVVDADKGHNLYFQVTATNFDGTVVATSAAFAIPATQVAPTNVVAPVIDRAVVGLTSSCTTGSWIGTSPINYTYQWYLNSSVIVGETNNTYIPIPGDFGENLKCVVTAHNTVGSASEDSNTIAVSNVMPVAPVNTVAPVISQAIVGSLSSCSTGTWTGTGPITYGYQWYLDGSQIGGATTSTYSPVSGDDGKALYCVVTATNAGGSASEQSNSLTVAESLPTIDIPNDAALDAAFAAWPTTGNKRWRLTGISYGTRGDYNHDFTSAPVVIDGLGAARFPWWEIAGSSGITYQDFTVYDQNPSVGASMWVHSDDVFPMNLTFNNIVSDSGQPMGTQVGGGWVFNQLTGSTITLNGQNDATRPDIQGRTFGIGFTSAMTFAAFVLDGYTFDNIGINSLNGGGVQNVTINSCLAMNNFYGPGDHPNAFHFFTSGPTHSANITFTNNAVWQGLFGDGPTGIFLETVDNVFTQNNWVFTGGQNGAFSNSEGTTLTNDNNFAQGIGGVTGGVMITRSGAVDTHCTNNTVQFLAQLDTNPGYIPASGNGSNTIIPVYGSSVTDKTYLGPWLAAHPTARPAPF